jgi:hypothetical protein
MTSTAGQGSGSKSEDMLATIMKQLAAMDARLQSMEGRLHVVDSIKAKVTTLEESTGELGAQQDTLSSAVERIDLAQTQFAAAADKAAADSRQPTPPDRHYQGNRRRQGRDEDDGGEDIIPTTHKLEFPKYDGTGDPLPWLNRCERYFMVHRTPEPKRIALAACYLLDDAQLWFHRLELNGGRPSWSQFIQLVNSRFGLPLTDTPLGELAMLRRTGSVDEFAKRFMALSCRDPTITEQQQIQLFTTGLGDPFRLDVALQQPASVDDAIIFARAYEQRLLSRSTGAQTAPRGSGRTASRYTQPMGTVPSATSGQPMLTTSSSPTTVLRFTPAEIAQRHKDKKCFHCDELFTPGHKQHCKQLFFMEVIQDDDDGGEQGLYSAESTISIAALTGIQPRRGRMMQVYVTVQGSVLRALLDSWLHPQFCGLRGGNARWHQIQQSSRVYSGNSKWRPGGELRQLHRFKD